ncbi:MAG: DNA repair protein RadA [Elusimicrobia bacterium]|nr:DNA repair protein RadA [Elusimicrobiota bacterium]
MKKQGAPRLRAQYRCAQCGYASPKPLGQCPECSAWNSMEEEVVADQAKTPVCRGLADFSSAPTPLADLAGDAPPAQRSATGLGEFDRLLGGGVVPGQVVLLAGPPGIGKSTLMLQAAARLSSKLSVLYVSGEESLKQVGDRARRLGIRGGSIVLLSETDLSKILAAMDDLKPGLVVMDSVQAVHHPDWPGTPGSVTQVRECSAELLRTAKGRDTVVFLLGHVTKEGALAGPKLLEHLVDTVLYFDTERHDLLRVLRASKNRFGPTDEIGLFEMRAGGLSEVGDAASLFLEEAGAGTAGRAVAVAMEGSRPILAEAQALVVTTHYPLPRRTATGLEYNRVLMLLAAMEKHLRLRLEDKDVFVSLAGGLKTSDPALDLAACMAVLSSARDAALPNDTVFIGEAGLLGRVGRVPFLEGRLREAAKAGFKRAVVPVSAGLPSGGAVEVGDRASPAPSGKVWATGGAAGLRVVPVKTLAEAAEMLRSGLPERKVTEGIDGHKDAPDGNIDENIEANPTQKGEPGKRSFPG